MRVCVLTTSYPRSADDVAGRFVADAVEHLRAAGHEVDVVSPASFRHFGIAYGGGIVQNLRARPWLALLLPAFLVSFAAAARRTARDADGEPTEPPHVLFVGRLSEEKGILEFLDATEGLPRVIVGDGPLRWRVPETVGFVPHDRLGAYYERAAVVCVPSRREGYGVVAREAMAYGRPVVATRVGGLVDAVEVGICGVRVRGGNATDLSADLAKGLPNIHLRERLLPQT